MLGQNPPTTNEISQNVREKLLVPNFWEIIKRPHRNNHSNNILIRGNIFPEI